MYTEFHMNASALDESFLKGIKSIFKRKNIFILVEEEPDETEYLLRSAANRKMLDESLNSMEGYEFSAREFKKLSNGLRRGKKADVSKFRKVKLAE